MDHHLCHRALTICQELWAFHACGTTAAMPVWHCKQGEEVLKNEKILCKPTPQSWTGPRGRSAGSDLQNHSLKLRNVGGLNILSLNLRKTSRESRTWLSNQWESTLKTRLGPSLLQQIFETASTSCPVEWWEFTTGLSCSCTGITFLAPNKCVVHGCWSQLCCPLPWL